MLKIKKGLKKKIKGKKDKGKEDDLFDPEQLEKYRKELEEKRRAQGDQDSSQASGEKPQDEEWLKFAALTAGVDTVLKKTTEDLGKIKDSSFYQKKTEPVNELWEEHLRNKEARRAYLRGERPDQKGAPGPSTEQIRAEEEAAKAPEQEVEEEPVAEEPVPLEDQETEELDDSLFDTSYLDAIASGEIQLAYIPDSPTEEEGDDPFDTSGVADVVKRIEEAENKAKRQVNLGGAVNYLSGKGQGPSDSGSRVRPRAGDDSAKRARARPRAVNLLGDFDSEGGSAGQTATSASAKSESAKPRDIFDDILDSPTKDGKESPILEKLSALPFSAAPVVVQVPNEDGPTNALKDVLGEFDLISQAQLEEPKDKQSSIRAPSSIAILASFLEPQEDDEFDEEFAALAVESIKKAPSPFPASKSEEDISPEEEDPFDTTFVEKIAPEVIQKDDDDDDFDFDPRVGEVGPPVSLSITAPEKCLLEDHSPSVENHPPAIQPHSFGTGPTLVDTSEANDAAGKEDADPFDTSIVEVALPGKAELKLLEEELLRAVEPPARPKLPQLPFLTSQPPKPVVEEDDDFDFDPRQGEEPKPSEHLFDLPHEGEGEGLQGGLKLLTPHLEPEEEEVDPFDTSIVSGLNLGPGALELKLLESELISRPEPGEEVQVQGGLHQLGELQWELSDPEFDPRGEEEPDPFIVVEVNAPLKTEDIFDHSEEIPYHKPLTPQLEFPPTKLSGGVTPSSEFEDPFDTSSIEVLKLLPASELKQIEGEIFAAPVEHPKQVFLACKFSEPAAEPAPLQNPGVEAAKALEAQRPPPPTHLFETDDAFEQELGFKPLTPLEVQSQFSDPFDTSIAESIVPGKIEIKILEQELAGLVGLSDPTFDPRGGGPQPIHPAALSFVSKTLEPVQVQGGLRNPGLSEDTDPFDTSGVGNPLPVKNTVPGREELKALEAELL